MKVNKKSSKVTETSHSLVFSNLRNAGQISFETGSLIQLRTWH